MQINGFDLIAPQLVGGEISEAETLGIAVWLWMHSSRHRDAPLHTLPTLLLPIIKNQQYAIACKAGQPVLFMGWAWMDKEAEQRYLTRASVYMQAADWVSGNRLWITDFIAPFGHRHELRRLVYDVLFAEHCFRRQDHQGGRRGQRIRFSRGSKVSKATAEAWREARPLSVALPEIG